MAKIELGMDFNTADNAVKEERKSVPTGTYRSRCFKPWEGSSIDTDDYLMKEAEINLMEEPSPNGTFTSIKSFK